MDDIYTRLANSASLSETTAVALALPTQIASSQNASEAVEESLQKLWKQVLTAAEQTPPEQQAYLVDIVEKLKNIDGGSLQVWNESHSWQQLPLLGPAMREKWNTTNKDDASWANINAFAARLTAANVYDFSLYCIWTMREALEDDDEDTLVIGAPPSGLKAVTAWIEYAMNALTSLSVQGKTFDGKMAKPGQSLANKEWRGFCEERWHEWARRLDKLAAERPDLAPVLSKTLAEVRKQ